MARCYLTKHGSEANHILKVIKGLKQKDIADELGQSRQVISYRMKNVYPKEIEEFITILDMAGYDIVERG